MVKDNQFVDSLINDPFSLTEDKSSSQQVTSSAPESLYDKLPEHRQSQARELASKIKNDQVNSIISYGANTQKKLNEFSHQVLEAVQVKDSGEIGQLLKSLMLQIEEHSPVSQAEQNFFQKLLNRGKQTLIEKQVNFQKLSGQLDRLAFQLQQEQKQLLADNQVLEGLYSQNKDYFEALNVYIAAAELKLKELSDHDIPNILQQVEAQTQQDSMIAQEVQDLQDFHNRLEKRTHDLKINRQMTIQQAAQIRLIQNTNQVLAEKIQSSIHTALPLWENQVIISLSLMKQEEALESQQMVSDTTNKLLKQNSQLLKQNTLKVAQESERGVVDLETLKETQSDLISTLEDVLVIQETGRKNRLAAQHELQLLEDQLQDKLLQVSKSYQEHTDI
ncbi:toxic anion resistance protein [Hutsoniella sourekii]|uniref:toxic anion resistance protein n=1 Tax=Hutsoniella sourekii TaxID=87650 RepID=UPI00047FAA45|nr:toxic anion resistance protein [Hutsoniella sourekii]